MEAGACRNSIRLDSRHPSEKQMDRPANNVLQSLNKKLRSQHMHDCVRSQRRIVREKERERETAEGGLPSCQGKEDGWGAGPGRVKGTGRFVKNPYA